MFNISLLNLFLAAKDHMSSRYLAIFGLFLLTSCNQTDAPEANIHVPSGLPVKADNAVAYMQDGTYCFGKLFNQDVTDVQLVISGNVVTGKMDWVPYEKDSARGTLRGYKNGAGELDLLFNYMIEGNRQTETKIMKIDNDKLLIKHGELLDAKNDGNLVYKNISQAEFTETLKKVDCKND